MDVDFRCTECAKCCHDLRLPLTVAEAMAWLMRGGDVEILCEVVPWPEGDLTNAVVLQKHERTFVAVSGALPVRIGVELVGHYVGSCPNLLTNGRCGIYEERPAVCRIYPAEINPFRQLDRSAKACPDDAWSAGPPMLRQGRIVDDETIREIATRRLADVIDVPTKRRLCALLGIRSGAVWREGFLAYQPGTIELLKALNEASDTAATEPVEDWVFISHRPTSVAALNSVGAYAAAHTNIKNRAVYVRLA